MMKVRGLVIVLFYFQVGLVGGREYPRETRPALNLLVPFSRRRLTKPVTCFTKRWFFSLLALAAI